MPAILQTELRNWRVRLLVSGMYAMLVLGGLTMVYPFLIMLSGSTKSNVDVNDYDLVPRYWHDDAMLYRKYVEEKCNEQFSTFSDNYGSDAFRFRDVQPPAPATPALVADWREFMRQPTPRGFYLLGASMSRDGQNVPPNLRAFRRHMQALCDGNVSALQKVYGLSAPNWMVVTTPYEPLADRSYQPSDSAFLTAFYQFKENCPAEHRVYLSLDRPFAEYVALLKKYSRDVSIYNRQNGTQFQAFSALTLAERCPSAVGLAEDWEGFVRERLNRQFLALDPGAQAGFASFLERKYHSIDRLNRLCADPGRKPYAGFADVALPTDKSPGSALLTDHGEFLRDRELLPTRWIRVDTPETRWRAFLQARYTTAAAAGKSHGRNYGAFAAIPMPQAEADRATCHANGGALRLHFVRRNFSMVFEYILLYGRGIRNTVIYCALAVLAALLVNPFAAYALSRFNLRGQYKLLLLLIATMAFPPVVTMIPNFLLIKELGLLNTFAALILPGVANGYSIFLLKGFFDSLPRELYEAADIDGASEWHKFWIITMALSKPILAVIALGAFVGAYANFMMAFILCQDERMWTLMVWLFKLQSFASQGVVFASLLVAAIPTLIMFLLCQNLIIRGMVVTTEK
jgi:multiple sugar transport system permease protein